MSSPGYLGSSAGKESACNVGDLGLILGWEDPLEKGRLPTPVFWPAKFHGLYSPWGLKESDTTEQPSLMSSPISQLIPPIPPLPESTSLFSVSASLFLPCSYVHLYHFSRGHIYVHMYLHSTYVNIWYLFFSDLFHSVWHPAGPSMSPQMTQFHSLLGLMSHPRGQWKSWYGA